METSNRLDRVLRIRSKTTTVYDLITPYLVVYDHNLRIMTDEGEGESVRDRTGQDRVRKVALWTPVVRNS